MADNIYSPQPGFYRTTEHYNQPQRFTHNSFTYDTTKLSLEIYFYSMRSLRLLAFPVFGTCSEWVHHFLWIWWCCDKEPDWLYNYVDYRPGNQMSSWTVRTRLPNLYYILLLHIVLFSTFFWNVCLIAYCLFDEKYFRGLWHKTWSHIFRVYRYLYDFEGLIHVF